MDRPALEQRWLHLTRETLPGLAATRDWPVSADHCFQRILLDQVCGGCWYDHVAGRPAYRHLPLPLLARAVDTAAALVAGSADLHQLNAQSLAWRGKGLILVLLRRQEPTLRFCLGSCLRRSTAAFKPPRSP